ncbi:MAG: DUF6445 family protein [Hyphomonas sp.]|uniref:DUF6445 family protein n=1 Tax=Hyphomonas sp. TaxID=87 RepID=UPI00349FF32C
MAVAPSPSIGRIGHEREPIIIIDGFSSDPHGLVDAAAGQAFGPRGPHYPGIRAPAPPRYLGERMDLLQKTLSDVFGLNHGADLVECNYSLVTTPAEELAPLQRLPHFDSADPGHFAVLHYLCGPEHGGTAFYRHRASGFETVSPSRMDDYSGMLDGELLRRPPAEGYLLGDTALFEQTYRVEAAFNRLVIYRGWTLHTGQVPPGHGLSPDPRLGRLTVNTFLKAR